MRTTYLILTLLIPSLSIATEKLPDAQRAFLKNHCHDCHGSDTQEMEINLDVASVDWSQRENLHLWERVLKALQSGQMPPADSGTVDDSEREMMVKWLDKTLTRHTPIGGALARRLNKSEYLATVKTLLGLSGKFELPQGFPPDSEHHGFDNLGEGLVLSPPLFKAYAETANLVADEVFPREYKLPESSTRNASIHDLAVNASAAQKFEEENSVRLATQTGAVFRSCTWPENIEIKTSGVYKIAVDLSTFRPEKDADPMKVSIIARPVIHHGQAALWFSRCRVLKEFEVTSESPETFTFEAELYKGQTPAVRWANAPINGNFGQPATVVKFLRSREKKNPRIVDAWVAVWNERRTSAIGTEVYWEAFLEQLARKGLPKASDEEKESFWKKVKGFFSNFATMLAYDIFNNGPSLEVHGLTIEGPSRLVDSPLDKERKRRRARLMGDPPETPEKFIPRFLSRAFRRPVDDATLATYLNIYKQHLSDGHTSNEAMHLVIRNVLISPRFLYRCLKDGPLDNHDLATRLSYFLTGGPPSNGLIGHASAGRLADPAVLKQQASGMMPRSPHSLMVKNFTGQWLDTRKLAGIMPDPKFEYKEERAAILEVEYFFAEMLRDNRPMTDFIDPDFTYASRLLAERIYGIENGNYEKAQPTYRHTTARGGRIGGVLGNSAVMLATANGVDTQPVLRGVWVLENILGTPPPPPPKAVPALVPDTTGATTPRELLSAHTSDAACAGCHRRIDPLGFMLESFDPVGRWREKWPGIEEPIDTSVTLSDGTQIKDIIEFKAWLVKNIDQFSQCLAEKLMTYATGRVPNYSERKEIAAIVKQNHRNGNGFRDLVLALIESKTFRTK